MKRKNIKLLCSAATLAAVFAVGIYAKRNDFGLSRNMEITMNMMRELSVGYVDPIDADKLGEGAAMGMVANLDPYTELIGEKDMSSFELMTTGKYSGIGAMIRQKDDYVRIAQPYKNSPADLAGLKIGDKILRVAGEDARGMTTEQVSTRLKGEAGTMVKLEIERLDGSRLKVAIRRDRVMIPGVPYAGMLNDTIGFVRHSDFTEGCYEEMRRAIAQLASEHRLKGLVLDYRSNGGGILQEAVKILSLFVPKGTEIVSTKGRQAAETYYTKTDPLYGSLPLVVLVNGNTASSAEIVSGSMQDLDRAVLIGQRTYGKGLVQSTRPMGYNTMLKYTTAKYYIPSGRCIQAIDYSESQKGSIKSVPDSLIHEYHTAAGRKIYDGGGIMPDVPTKPEYFSRFAATVYALGFVDDFGDDYTKRHWGEQIDVEHFSITEQDYKDFVAFMQDKDVPYESESRQALKKLKQAAKRDRLPQIEAEIAKMEQALKDDKTTNFETYKEQLIESINTNIIQRHGYMEGVIAHSLSSDQDVKRAVELLSNPEEYRRILREQDTLKKIEQQEE